MSALRSCANSWLRTTTSTCRPVKLVLISGMPTPSSSSDRSAVMNSAVVTANASSCAARPAFASRMRTSTVSMSCSVPRDEQRLAGEHLVAVDADLRALLGRAEDLAADVVEQHDSVRDDQLRPEVRVPAGDARRGVDDHLGLGGDQRLGGRPVDVDVVDDRDVAGVEPPGEPDGSPVEPGDAVHPRELGAAAAQGCQLHGCPCCHRIGEIFGAKRAYPASAGSQARASASSSAACSRAVWVSEPASMRASSATRSASVTIRTSLATMPACSPGAGLSTTTC